MRKLGISIYPDRSKKEDLLSYIDKMSEAGFSRIFSCLLSSNGTKEEIIKNFYEINSYAKSKGFEIIVDVSPKIFTSLRISYDNLKFFKDINADGLRLDEGFSGFEESMMTYNPYNLKIEINMSNNVHTIDTIMDYRPNRFNLYGCHNFYPHEYSGLRLNHFLDCSSRFKKYGLRTATFVSSQNKDAFGPWPVCCGLPTLEIHRNIPLDVQINHHIAMDAVDDIIISNCYPSEDEIKKLKDINLNILTLKVHTNNNIKEFEQSILKDAVHFNRGDVSDYLIRSTQSRVKYKNKYFELYNAPELIKRGDVIIESSENKQYSGEMQIVLKDIKNNKTANVVGRIADEEIFLLDYIKPWQHFKLKLLKDI